MSRISDSGSGKQAAGNLGDTAQQVSQNLRDLGGQVRDAAKEKYDQLGDQARAYYDQGKQAATEWEQGLESYVQEKPLQALLVAGGIGLLLGLLWRRH